MEFQSYIKNADCFDEFENIPSNSINLVLVDLPYGQTSCAWDLPLDLGQMWESLNRIAKDNCIFVFFCTTKYGIQLINSNPAFFRYDLVWQKHIPVGFLSSNKMPLRKHEMIYIFAHIRDDLRIERNLELRQYAQKVREYIGLPYKEIRDIFGNSSMSHFYGFKNKRFGLPTEKNYKKLTELFNLEEMQGFMPYEEMKSKWEKLKLTYNPQKTKGKPRIDNEGNKGKIEIYRNYRRMTYANLSGDRHPTSILKFNRDRKSYHTTQKPLDLLEWIIKTYSNEGDLVLDFVMGSGSTIEACMNTNRRYIGIEKDEEIFLIAKNRLKL